ncbi:Tannase and feruloyl esterase [compost metagenome]
MTDWVEKGVTPPDAPEMRAMQKVPPHAVSATKPLCRYPLYPRYLAGGDVKKAASYTCSAS